MAYSSIFSKSNFIKTINLPGFKEYKKGVVFKNSLFRFNFSGTATVNGIISFFLEINGDFCNIIVDVKDSAQP